MVPRWNISIFRLCHHPLFLFFCYLICVFVNIYCKVINGTNSLHAPLLQKYLFEVKATKCHLQVREYIAAAAIPESTIMTLADCTASVMGVTLKPLQLRGKHFSVYSDWASYISLTIKAHS